MLLPSRCIVAMSLNYFVLHACIRLRARIESVPLKQLIKLSGFRKRRWAFKDGWLTLEAS